MRTRRGVTLIEMVVVLAIVGLLVAVATPNIGAGIDALRLTSASEELVSFLNAAQNASERRQVVVELSVEKEQSRIVARSSGGRFERTYQTPEGVRIAGLVPDVDLPEDQPRRFLLLPGGLPPRIVVTLRNERKAEVRVMVDPVNGNPRIERGGE